MFTGGHMTTNAVKHTPATQLPWKAHSANKASNFGSYESHIRTESGLPMIAKARGGNDDTAEAAKQNAAYIAHSANAYPKLVDALRNMTHGFRVTGGPSGSSEHAAFVGAEYLLRELGEE